MKVGDLVQLKDVDALGSDDVGVITAIKAKGACCGHPPIIESTVLWSRQGRIVGYLTSDLEVIQ